MPSRLRPAVKHHEKAPEDSNSQEGTDGQRLEIGGTTSRHLDDYFDILTLISFFRFVAHNGILVIANLILWIDSKEEKTTAHTLCITACKLIWLHAGASWVSFFTWVCFDVDKYGQDTYLCFSCFGLLLHSNLLVSCAIVYSVIANDWTSFYFDWHDFFDMFVAVFIAEGVYRSLFDWNAERFHKKCEARFSQVQAQFDAHAR
jgi:hypothetical protein